MVQKYMVKKYKLNNSVASFLIVHRCMYIWHTSINCTSLFASFYGFSVELFSSTVQADSVSYFMCTAICYDKRIEHLHINKNHSHSFVRSKDLNIENEKYFLLTGSSSINLMYNFIYGIILLLYGCFCVVGLSCIGMVLSSRTKVGTRSDRKQIAFIPFGCVGYSSITNDIGASIGKS